MKNKIKIRLYKSNDIDEVIQMFKDSISGACKNDYSAQEIEAWINALDKDKLQDRFLTSYSIVAVMDSIIVGFGNIDIENRYLDCLYVRPKFYRSGIASRICEELESKVSGAISVHSSKTAKAFFLNRGYSLIAEQTVIRKEIKLTNYLLIKY